MEMDKLTINVVTHVFLVKFNKTFFSWLVGTYPDGEIMFTTTLPILNKRNLDKFKKTVKYQLIEVGKS